MMKHEGDVLRTMFQALCAGLVQFGRAHGARNSSLLFLNWLLQTVANTLIFQSHLRQHSSTVRQKPSNSTAILLLFKLFQCHAPCPSRPSSLAKASPVS